MGPGSGWARSSTGRGDAVPLLEALDRGPAPDGGLYLPVEWPLLDPPPASLGASAADTAAWAAPRILPGLLPEEEMVELIRDAFSFPIPLTRPFGPGGPALLELFHGPTLAFKDVGARVLARLWSRVPGGPGHRTVLVATSGDTGGAVAQACHGIPGVDVAVLFPSGRVSDVQRRQFSTLGGNVVALAVDGPFDRCQALAREALADPVLARRFALTSANSINLGRLLPQVLYYLHLARELGWGREEPPAALPAVVVPSGNLGNVTAALLARRAGAPLGTLVAATNANEVLPTFLADGTTREAPVVRTLSTAMDVGAPSNLARLVALSGGNPRELARELEAVGVSDDATRAAMRWAWASGVEVDPHTAVGLAAALDRDTSGAGAPVVVATAHPAKFPEVVADVLGRPPTPHPALNAALEREEDVVPLTGGLGQVAEVLERRFGARREETP